MAAQEGHVAIVESLLKNKADPNLTLTNGTTPLMMASQKGCNDVVKLLLKAGADFKKKLDNRTALSLANLAGQKKTAQILKDAGAAE
jgi:ankyrin repeat protein